MWGAAQLGSARRCWATFRCMINTPPKQPGVGGRGRGLFGFCFQVKVHLWGKSGQELKQEFEVETVEGDAALLTHSQTPRERGCKELGCRTPLEARLESSSYASPPQSLSEASHVTSSTKKKGV